MTLSPTRSVSKVKQTSIQRAGISLLGLSLATLLTGCQTYKFDRDSVSTILPATSETATVPFQVAGYEKADWLIPAYEDAPGVALKHSVERVHWEGTSFLGFLATLGTLSLIPGHDKSTYADVYELSWQGESLAQSRLEYSVDGYVSLYFPTPLLFLGSWESHDLAERAKAKAYLADTHKTQLLSTIDEQQTEFERINPQTTEEIADYLSGPGEHSVYRPQAMLRLIDLAPETNALAYHSTYLPIRGYLQALPLEYQAWLIGPEGLRGIDLQGELEQGVTADDLLIRVVKAYPPEEQRQLTYLPETQKWARVITSHYYTGMTDAHRTTLKEAGLPARLVDRMTNDEPSPQLVAAVKTGKLRDASGNIRIPTKEELLEQLVRNDNLGKYMSPYTSDDVLAEWVNSAINANIGSTVGTGVGAAAGAYLGEKALEQVPFVGSFLGGAVGAEVGKSVGRETAISASGGWEAIRRTSDRSFDDISSMARYLKAKYGHTGNFADAMDATRQIYPELAETLAQVR